MLLCTILLIIPVEQNWRWHCLNHPAQSQPKEAVDRIVLLHSEGKFKENPKSTTVLEFGLFLIKKSDHFICSKAFLFLSSSGWFSELILMAIQLEIKLSSESPPVTSWVTTLLDVLCRSKSRPILHRTEPVLAEKLMTFNNNAEVYLSPINTNHTKVKFTHNFL